MLLYCSYKKNHKYNKPQLLVSASITNDDGGGGSDVTMTKRPPPPPPPRPEVKKYTNYEPLKVEATAKAAEEDTTQKSSRPPATSSRHYRHHSDPSHDRSTGSTGRHHRHHHRVRFRSVQLQEYSVTVGDHPYCKGFFPLTLDWSHARPIEININDYEASRKKSATSSSHYDYHHGKLKWDQLHLDSRERFERLRLVSGMTETDLAYLEQCRQQQQPPKQKKTKQQRLATRFADI